MTIVVLGGALLLYFALLCYPQSFFAQSIEHQNLILYSDHPFNPEAGAQVLALAYQKLSASPLFSAKDHYSIFVCHARWRQRLFFNRVYGVGGVNFYPLTDNIFIRDSIIEENRLIGPSGKVVASDRPLDYFIAHEITHALTGKAIGPLRYYRLSEWVREGYADYVGKGEAFKYDEALRAFLANAPEMDRWRSGLYLRYHLLAAYLLDKKYWSLSQVLADGVAQNAVEDELRKQSPLPSATPSH